ncbi:MAG: TonB-dependent receptor [Caulobacterales bacterium]
MNSIGSARLRGRGRRLLAATSSCVVLALAASLCGGASLAADATATATDAASATAGGGAGGEGIDITSIIVAAEKNQAAATAPTKASLDQTQPESIISHAYIEQVTPETGGWTTVLTIAPSISGITSNGGGIGDYNVVSMRGFKDGQFNITYDGIAFGDTNDPTHHGADYWPASTIGAAVVDRGPGAAGDLGQENFGGAIHFYSPDVADTFGVVQKLTYGSFNTFAAVTTLNTGAISQAGGAKLLLNFDERSSNGELSGTNGVQYNQMAKLIVPIGDKIVLTVFGAHEFNFFHFEDSAGPGETWQQTLTLGRNFSMNNDPLSEHFTGYNYELKRTDFEYVDLKYQITPTFLFENQVYTYWYSNKTHSTNDLTGYLGPDLNGVPGTANTSPLTAKNANTTDIGGYDKLNEYRVVGGIFRLTQNWSFGTLKVGGVVEGSRTFRHNCFIDDTTGFTPDIKFKPPAVAVATNCKLLEESSWLQGQFFVDFNWRPTDQLTISPGFKYLDWTRNVNATNENVGGGLKNQPLVASNNYKSPVYFLTANYRIQPDWSVYGQIATSYLVPALSSLYVTGASLQTLKPQTTINYQAGTVYTHGAITADADVYLIDANNLQVGCTVPNPIGGPPLAAFCNAGKARYDGIEGEAAYAFDFGLTLFGNASWNEANSLNPTMRLANAPSWTGALGAIYHHGPWEGSLTYKQVGDFVNYNGATVFHLPGYGTLDASAAYDFGRFKVKLQAFNLLNARAITSFTPGGNSAMLFATVGNDGKPDGGLYTYQAGTQVELTLIGKF